MKIKLKVITILLFFVSGLASAALTEQEKSKLFEQSNKAFHKANSITDDKQAREDAYEKAIIGYETIIKQGPVRNPKLYYNLANAYFLKGEVGEAILNYRRAIELDSSDKNINKNLAFARASRQDKFEIGTEEKIIQTLFFWHYDFSVRTRFLVGLVSFAVFCLLVSIGILRGKKSSMWLAAVFAFVFAAAFLGSVIFEQQFENDRYYGVITADQAVARRGDGKNYPESFNKPLNEGVEFRLIEKRNGWMHVELPDGSDCWLESSNVDII